MAEPVNRDRPSGRSQAEKENLSKKGFQERKPPVRPAAGGGEGPSLPTIPPPEPLFLPCDPCEPRHERICRWNRSPREEPWGSGRLRASSPDPSSTMQTERKDSSL